MNKKVFIILICIIWVMLMSLCGYTEFQEQQKIKNLKARYSHIIYSRIELNMFDDKVVKYKPYNKKSNTIVFAVSASCEKCYTKLNQLYELMQSSAKYEDANILIVILGSYGNDKIVRLLDQYRLNYVIDEDDQLLKNNRYFSVNQIYVVDSSNKVLILGDLFFGNKAITRIFAHYLRFGL